MPILRFKDDLGNAFPKWETASFDDLFYVANNKKLQIKSSDFLDKGSVPIIDQGKKFIAGYTNNLDSYTNIPVIIFGDHTRIFKWVDFPFAIGADGTQVIKVRDGIQSKFGYYALCNLDLPNHGYSRHMKELRSQNFSIPKSLGEQEKISTFYSLIDEKISEFSSERDYLVEYKKIIRRKILNKELRFKDENGKDFPEWRKVSLDCLLDYEQPSKYLVSSTEYSDLHKTPVLTAGKTFILGFTDEQEGIFTDDLPVIIFDDFTTAIKYVDFPFKAKSSAMKILKNKDITNSIKFIYEAMECINFPLGDEHKRYWISEYSSLFISLPSPQEQVKIVSFLALLDKKIDHATSMINITNKYKKCLLSKMLSPS